MAKKVEGYIKLQIPAGKGNTSTTRWTSTWTARVNIVQFTKEFNARTADQGRHDHPCSNHCISG